MRKLLFEIRSTLAVIGIGVVGMIAPKKSIERYEITDCAKRVANHYISQGYDPRHELFELNDRY